VGLDAGSRVRARRSLVCAQAQRLVVKALSWLQNRVVA
jgi:hypothetical protein